jgi:hypothetical protein
MRYLGKKKKSQTLVFRCYKIIVAYDFFSRRLVVCYKTLQKMMCNPLHSVVE